MKLKLSALVCGVTLAVSANATNLFSNNGFETNGGNGTTAITGWTIAGTAGSDDAFYADNTITTPLNGFETVGAFAGSYYAVSDMTGIVTPEEAAIYQTVTIPGNATAVGFMGEMFVDDVFGGSGSGAEIAIWANGANPLTATPLYVIQAFVDTAETGSAPNPYVLYSQIITAQVTPGTTYEFGVLEEDSTGPINVGLDSFQLLETGPALATPEPGMLLPMALLAIGTFIYYRARRRFAAKV
jgi:hypothetical protein